MISSSFAPYSLSPSMYSNSYGPNASGTTPTSVVITGTPQDIASSNGNGVPSMIDVQMGMVEGLITRLVAILSRWRWQSHTTLTKPCG